MFTTTKESEYIGIRQKNNWRLKVNFLPLPHHTRLDDCAEIHKSRYITLRPPITLFIQHNEFICLEGSQLSREKKEKELFEKKTKFFSSTQFVVFPFDISPLFLPSGIYNVDSEPPVGVAEDDDDFHHIYFLACCYFLALFLFECIKTRQLPLPRQSRVNLYGQKMRMRTQRRKESSHIGNMCGWRDQQQWSERDLRGGERSEVEQTDNVIILNWQQNIFMLLREHHVESKTLREV